MGEREIKRIKTGRRERDREKESEGYIYIYIYGVS